jgi:hypothetical protein
MRYRRPLIAIGLLILFGIAGCALVTQPLVRPIRSEPANVDAATLERHVRELAGNLHPRSSENFSNLQRAGDYILAAFIASGGETDVQKFEVQGNHYRNLIARFGPRQGPVLVIGAHYDANGETPGADDNASGVAGLLELARLLGANAPPQPVELVAYTLEEPPYFRTTSMGSFQHAQALAESKREVRLMISLEMIGYFRDEPDSQQFPVPGLELLYPDQGDFIAIVGRFGDFSITRRVKALGTGATNLPIESINAPAKVPGVDFSDHLSYWHFKLPAVMVTDTAFLRNPNYHQVSDTPDTLDYGRMAKVVQAVYAVAKQY